MGGACSLLGPGSPDRRDTRLDSAGPVPPPWAWGCPLPPGRQGGTAGAGGTQRVTRPLACFSRTIAVPTSQMRKPETAPASRSGWMRPPAAWPTPTLPAACSSQGSTRDQAEARASRPHGAGQHRDTAPPASRAPPASARSPARPGGAGRPVTDGLGVDDNVPQGPPSPRGPALHEAISLEPRAPTPLPGSSQEAPGSFTTPQRPGFLPRAQPEALLSVSTVSSSEKPQV